MSDYTGEDPESTSWIDSSNYDGLVEDLISPAKRIQDLYANPGQFPHQVLLQLPSRDGKLGSISICGASIIHPLLILTAAHCLYDGIDLKAINATAGELRRSYLEGPEQFLQVHSAIVHPKLNNSTWDNDIAILTLKTSIQFDNFKKPIRIPERGQQLPETANVSGWGVTLDTKLSSVHLQYVEVPFSDRQTCREAWNKTWGKVVTENMICAGDNERDACAGDSGGPLTCVDENTKDYFLCGIVSYGFQCDSKSQLKISVPGLYTDVRRYHKWIRKHMQIWWRYYWNLRYGEPLETSAGRSCGKGNFQCKQIESCIPESFRCDGEDDCAPWDKSDEDKCTEIKCAEGRFHCGNRTRCVPQSFVRDGDDDCGDNSDEANSGVIVY